MRIVAPTYFQTPNDLVDHWLPLLGEAETKLLLVIIRKTFGWQKETDRISLSQFEKITGLTRTNAINGLKSLVSKGIIKKDTFGNPGKEESFYSLLVEDSNNSYQYLSDTGGGVASIPGGVSQRYPQNKVLNTSIEKQQQAAAAFSENKHKQEPKIYECLLKEDCPESEKIWLTKNFSEADVIYGIQYADSQETYKSCRLACIKWATKTKPKIKLSEEKIIAENKSYAKNILKSIVDDGSRVIEVLNTYVEIFWKSSPAQGTVIDYKQNGFKNVFQNAINRYGFKLKAA